ncbi:MAG TPA: OmpA family protein [Chitinophagales bacterium]|nr:OmpA family protein [Chitinophagales bacterium]
MNRCLLLFCLVVIVIGCNARNAYVKKGDKLMRKFRFEQAAAQYKKAVDADANNLDAWEKLANAFTTMADYKSAEAIYQALANNSAARPVNKFYYGQVLRINGKYADAAKAYTQFAIASPNDPRAAGFKNFEEDIKPLQQDSKVYEFATLPENTPASELGPAYNAGKLVFASNRGKGNAVRMVDFWTGKGYYDIYEQRSAGAGDSVIPAKMKGKINKRLNEGPATFSRDGKEMIFTRTNYKTKGADGIQRLGLYHADFDASRNKWVNIRPLPFTNSEYNVAHPSLSKDGKRLYFISDMPGGLGETDIYVSIRNAYTWEQPIPLGKDVNTVGREMFPFIADDGTLYFSSDCRVGLGGLDVYYTRPDGNKWGAVQNAGAGMNSAADDFGYVTDETGKHGFMVTDRAGGAGSDDIYKFTRLAEPVCGTVIDAKTKSTIANAQVVLSVGGSEGYSVRSNSKGDFCINMEPGYEYLLDAAADGYKKYQGTLRVKSAKNDRKIIQMEPKGDIDLTVDVLQKDAGNLEGATAFLINKKTGEVQQQKSDAAGKVKFELFKDQEYDLKVVKKLKGQEGVYDKFVKTISTMGFTSNTQLNEKAQLTFYEGSMVFDLPNVYFDYNSAVVKPSAAKELDKIASVMKAFPDVQVELSAHTDARGKADVNMVMSARRAKACVDYLAGKGVDIKQLIAVGYGEEKIRNRCKEEVVCTDKEHAVNRRTEFRVLKFD